MKDKFLLSQSDDEAADAFRRLIHQVRPTYFRASTGSSPVLRLLRGWQSLNTKMTSLNWFVHIAVHNGKMPVLTHR